MLEDHVPMGIERCRQTLHSDILSFFENPIASTIMVCVVTNVVISPAGVPAVHFPQGSRSAWDAENAAPNPKG